MEKLVRLVADKAMAYSYKRWGFGEDIALRGLIDVGTWLGERKYLAFAEQMLKEWAAESRTLGFPDHVVPGIPLLMLYDKTGEELYLEGAHRLAGLYETFPRHGGIPVHRPDLTDWKTHIWVDCMYMDAPFLIRYGRLVGESRFVDIGMEHVRSYLDVLQDSDSGLFYHGFDTQLRERSAHAWGRGNGWAMLGLIDTLDALPADHPHFQPIRSALERQVRAVVPLQGKSGHWHTILDDASSPVETSIAAFFSAGIWSAVRLGLLPRETELLQVAARAFEAARNDVAPDGTLKGVSEATPIGDRSNYCDRATGSFPWGQGPLLLAAMEKVRLQKEFSE